MSGAESAAGAPTRIESTRSLIAVNAITILLALIFALFTPPAGLMSG